ncbi:hypothetical protein [uncultured Methanobrevibacter sp.]|nr:hypothetical protein [uncultured Methanobrevibacter sp.]
MANEISSGSETNMDSEIRMMSIIIKVFNVWIVKLLSFIISHI